MINFKEQIKKILFSPPKFIIKILPLNFLGMQIFRIFFYNSKIKIKKFFIQKNQEINLNKKIYSDMNENGYSIIENFFSNSEFNFILETTQKIEEEKVFIRTNYGNVDVLLGPLDLTEKYKKEIAIINKFFFDKKIINIISNIIGERVSYFPVSTFQKIYLKEKLEDKDDINSEYHPDRFYPCVKSFYYINDNSLENGAFSYFPKSHKLNFDRIKYEYINSIFNSTSWSDKNYSKFNFEKVNGRITLMKKKLYEIYGDPVICEAPRNSFVLANNMGFHKRGKMQQNKTRIHLRNNFYDFQINSLLLKIKNKFRNLKK